MARREIAIPEHSTQVWDPRRRCFRMEVLRDPPAARRTWRRDLAFTCAALLGLAALILDLLARAHG